ncbi:two-component system, chemotaxis family, protein-glutamate methylesterase/glutaminase [Gammaproteobacteria bacterium]
MNILVVEDNEMNARQLMRILSSAGYEFAHAYDGLQAKEKLAQSRYDAVITDWLMPNMDGAALIRHIRANIRPVPLTIMVTILGSPQAKQHALQCIGVDEFIAKPYDPQAILKTLKTCFLRLHQPQPELPTARIGTVPPLLAHPPHPVVCVTADSGGPLLILRFAEEIRPSLRNASLLIVQHGPTWMLETFVEMLRNESNQEASLAEEGMEIKPGHVYVAPGGRHMEVRNEYRTLKIVLSDTPSENYARPSADPLLRSVAKVFGKYSVAVVLTGLGRDGSLGSAEIHQVGGTVLAQSPETCTSPSMPETVIKLGIVKEIFPPEAMVAGVSRYLRQLEKELRQTTSS